MSDADWTDDENNLIVADYFAMLIDELATRPYSKAEYNRNIQQLLSQRSRGSIEFKHQNISAVMLGLGQPWINGYKPASRFQLSLIDAVLRWMEANPEWILPRRGQIKNVQALAVQEESTLWIGPAPTFANELPPVDVQFMAAVARKYDVAERDGRNRLLGKAGEECVVRREKSSLRQANRQDLADKVRWTSVEDGDGAGYDIKSFETDGSARLIEVKTTNGWERTPFHISRNELAVAEANRDTWHLVRLWNFAREPRAFSIRPPLDAHVALTPTSFLASFH